MKTNKSVILFIAIFLNISCLYSQELEYVKDLIENERYQHAEAILEKANLVSPQDPEASYLLVKTYLEQEKARELEIYINDQLLPAMKNNDDALNKITYSRYLLSVGNKLEADKIVHSVLSAKKNQRNSALLIAIAEVYISEEAGDPKEALDWLDLAEKRDRTNPSIDLLKGLAFKKLSDASQAFEAYQEALKKDPENVKAHYLLGKIFTAQKNPGIYMEHFRKAYQLDSTFAPVLKELYKYYYYRDLKLAKKFLKKYIDNSDPSLQNEYDLTDILYLNGEFETAIRSANEIIKKEQENSQPRLYKLIAYSYFKAGDSLQALRYINYYFDKQEPDKMIAADFDLKAQLMESKVGVELEAVGYYSIAAEMDTVTGNKATYAAKIAELYKRVADYHHQAIWLGRLYQWKVKRNNVDLFNWGLAHYSAKEYPQTDSVFSLYITRYPKDIYGYYWRAQANAAIDTSMTSGLAIPFYNKVVEIGELNNEANKKMLLKAYGYLGGYDANIGKDYSSALNWFEKYLELDRENADIMHYVEMLKKWIAEKK